MPLPNCAKRQGSKTSNVEISLRARCMNFSSLGWAKHITRCKPFQACIMAPTMNNRISRRDALRNVAAAGTGGFLTSAQALAQVKPLEVAGKPVELTLTSVTPQTVRITVQPIENGQPKPVPQDGALVKEDFGKPAFTVRAFAGTRNVKCGGLTVKLIADPFSIRVE